MNRRTLLFMVVLTGFLLPTISLAGEGWLLKLQHTEAGMSQAEIRLEGDRIRASEEGMAQEVILGRDRMTVLDHNQKNYMVITYAQIEAEPAPAEIVRAMALRAGWTE